jgi:cell filamentation protein
LSDKPDTVAQREADLVGIRIAELQENPVRGNFDAEHLKAIHAYIFQDLPHHKPGSIRADTANWVKHRLLEGQRAVYEVAYAHENVTGRIAGILGAFGGPVTLKGRTADAIAARLADLYGDLDHAHGFYEGNSRTLREFSREPALAAGYRLDWTATAAGTSGRNELYIARDIAVLERAFPGLTPERAAQTTDRAEYEASFVLPGLRAAMGNRSLEAIIRDGLTPSSPTDRAHT